jgi:hypothetical protein
MPVLNWLGKDKVIRISRPSADHERIGGVHTLLGG